MKTIAVIVRAAEPARIAEALRAAVGLTLRGDRLRVVVPAGAAGRAIGTLALLGHEVTHGEASIAAALDGADAVEVWS